MLQCQLKALLNNIFLQMLDSNKEGHPYYACSAGHIEKHHPISLSVKNNHIAIAKAPAKRGNYGKSPYSWGGL